MAFDLFPNETARAIERQRIQTAIDDMAKSYDFTKAGQYEQFLANIPEDYKQKAIQNGLMDKSGRLITPYENINKYQDNAYLQAKAQQLGEAQQTALKQTQRNAALNQTTGYKNPMAELAATKQLYQAQAGQSYADLAHQERNAAYGIANQEYGTKQAGVQNLVNMDANAAREALGNMVRDQGISQGINSYQIAAAQAKLQSIPDDVLTQLLKTGGDIAGLLLSPSITKAGSTIADFLMPKTTTPTINPITTQYSMNPVGNSYEQYTEPQYDNYPQSPNYPTIPNSMKDRGILPPKSAEYYADIWKTFGNMIKGENITPPEYTTYPFVQSPNYPTIPNSMKRNPYIKQ